MKWGEVRWRRLYIREEGSFALLPLYVRALAGELLKFVDDEGRLYVGERDPAEVIARLAGAEVGERRMLRTHIPILIADGYLVRDGAYLVVKNFGVAQGRERKATHARVENESSASDARPVRESCTSEERTENESRTSPELSARNDSGLGLVRAPASERSEEIREEEKRSEIPPTPQGGLAGADSAPGQGGLFRLDAPEPSAKKKRPRKVPGERPSHERYALAYAAGIVDIAGGQFTPPTDTHAQFVFRKALPIHALDAGGDPLTGAELETWIRKSAAEYRRARSDSAAFEGGFKPAKWLDWLQGGKVGAANHVEPCGAKQALSAGFARGHEAHGAAGYPVPQDPRDEAALAAVVAARCPTLTGDDVANWITHAVQRFLRARDADPDSQYWKGGTGVQGFVNWIGTEKKADAQRAEVLRLVANVPKMTDDELLEYDRKQREERRNAAMVKPPDTPTVRRVVPDFPNPFGVTRTRP